MSLRNKHLHDLYTRTRMHVEQKGYSSVDIIFLSLRLNIVFPYRRRRLIKQTEQHGEINPPSLDVLEHVSQISMLIIHHIDHGDMETRQSNRHI